MALFIGIRIKKLFLLGYEFDVFVNLDCTVPFIRKNDILNTIKEADPNTKWLVGTELNLVNRLANEMKAEGKLVQFMSHVVCECSTMARIDPQHLAWTLENIINFYLHEVNFNNLTVQ